MLDRKICYMCLSSHYNHNQEDRKWRRIFNKIWRREEIPCPKSEQIDSYYARKFRTINPLYLWKITLGRTRTNVASNPKQCPYALEHLLKTNPQTN
jgi:hypothetical protein